MKEPYLWTLNTDMIFEVKDAENTPISVDVSPQDYWDAVSWETRQKVRASSPYPLPKNSYCYSDLGRLIEHFKKCQGLIAVGPGDRPIGISRSIAGTETRISTDGKPSLFSMPTAIVIPEDPDFIFSGCGGEAKSGLHHTRSDAWVTKDLFEQINRELCDENSEIRKVSTWAINRTFVYLDVSDFSKMPPGHQTLVINSIVRLVKHDPYWEQYVVKATRNDMEAMICIGDGYIFVFRNALKATCFAAYLAQLTEHLIACKQVSVEFHFRMGIHTGPVFCFWDPGRNNWNYIGDGINGGQRVLGAVGKDTDDVLFISSQVRKRIMAEYDAEHAESVVNHLHNRGRRADKHGNSWRVYEVSHTALYGLTTSFLRFEEEIK